MKNKKEDGKITKKKGKIIIVSGPSGVGKSTIVKEIIKNEKLNLKFSVSLTTRKARSGEIDGINYHFVNKKEFLAAIKKNELLEYTIFVENYYGTKKNDVDHWINEGYNVLLEIEIEGAKQIFKKYKKNEIISFFIMPPNFEELKKRIQNRLTENDNTIKNRLERANEEIKFKSHFNYVIINDVCDKAKNEITKIIENNIS